MADITNPYAVLVNVVAPAMLTNASSLLTLSTANRLARAVDRAREIAKVLTSDFSGNAIESPQMREMLSAELRAHMLLRALRWFYVAISGFATATFTTVLGQLATAYKLDFPLHLFELIGVITGFVGVVGMVSGASLLVRETSVAVASLDIEAKELRTELNERSRALRQTQAEKDGARTISDPGRLVQ